VRLRRETGGGIADYVSHRPGSGESALKGCIELGYQALYDVIGKIPGSTFPDEWVIRGKPSRCVGERAEDPISDWFR